MALDAIVPSIERENNIYFISYCRNVGDDYEASTMMFIENLNDMGLRVTRLTTEQVESIGADVPFSFLSYLHRRVNSDLFEGWTTKLPSDYHKGLKDRNYRETCVQ